jgi:hypothetical protein
VKLPPVEFERPITTLVAVTVSESATEPVAIVKVVDGELSDTPVLEAKVSGAAFAIRTKTPSIAATITVKQSNPFLYGLPIIVLGVANY